MRPILQRAVGLALAGVGLLFVDCGSSQIAPADAGHPPKAVAFDVVVVGAGTGGTAAAVAAARHGAKVLVVEPTGWIGGQMAAVPLMDDAFLPGFVTTGFADEIERKVVAHYAALGKSVHTCYSLPSTVCAEPHVIRDILTATLAAAGVTVKLHTDVISVQKTGDRVTGVTLSDDTVVSSKVLIDASEYGDVLPLAGAEYRVGNQVSSRPLDPNACVQNITFVGTMRKYTAVPTELVAVAPAGYDARPPGAGASYILTEHQGFATFVTDTGTGPPLYPWDFAHHNKYRGVPDSANPGSYDNTQPTLITRTSINLANDYPPFAVDTAASPQKIIASGTLPIAFIEDKRVRQELLCAAKLHTLAFLHYVQTELPSQGGNLWSLANDEGSAESGPSKCPKFPPELAALEALLAPVPYVRESRRIVAVHTLTGSEIARPTPGDTGKPFHTAVARAVYGMDLHECQEDAELEAELGDSNAVPRGGGPVEVPFESLVPLRVDGLVAAEKNIGVSRLANGSTRLQGVTMLTGQAAGTLAALAVLHDVAPRVVDPFEVQRLLVADGAGLALADYDDVPAGDPRWGAVQLVAVRGLMSGTAPTTFSPDANLTRAQAAVVLSALFRLTVDPAPATSDFADVGVGDPFFKYIEAIFKAGFTAGCGGGNFCPAGVVTRAQLAVFLVKGLGISAPPCTAAPFGDVPTTDAACPAIAYATQKKLLGGCSAGNFCPTTAVVRGDAAAPFVQIMITNGPPL